MSKRKASQAIAIRPAAAFCDCNRGSAAIEFSVLAPVFLLILAAVIDIGLVLRERFEVNAEVSSAANLSLVSERTDPEQFVRKVAGQLGSPIETAEIVFNKGAIAQLSNGSLDSRSGGETDQCYCPTRSLDEIEWGEGLDCSDTCADGTSAGRYVEIFAQTRHQTLFGRFGLGDTVSVQTLVRVD